MQQFLKKGPSRTVEPVSLNSVKSVFGLINYFVIKPSASFKGATFFSVNRHELGVLNE